MKNINNPLLEEKLNSQAMMTSGIVCEFQHGHLGEVNNYGQFEENTSLTSCSDVNRQGSDKPSCFLKLDVNDFLFSYWELTRDNLQSNNNIGEVDDGWEEMFSSWASGRADPLINETPLEIGDSNNQKERCGSLVSQVSTPELYNHQTTSQLLSQQVDALLELTTSVLNQQPVISASSFFNIETNQDLNNRLGTFVFPDQKKNPTKNTNFVEANSLIIPFGAKTHDSSQLNQLFETKHCSYVNNYSVVEQPIESSSSKPPPTIRKKQPRKQSTASVSSLSSTFSNIPISNPKHLKRRRMYQKRANRNSQILNSAQSAMEFHFPVWTFHLPNQ